MAKKKNKKKDQQIAVAEPPVETKEVVDGDAAEVVVTEQEEPKAAEQPATKATEEPKKRGRKAQPKLTDEEKRERFENELIAEADRQMAGKAVMIEGFEVSELGEAENAKKILAYCLSNDNYHMIVQNRAFIAVSHVRQLFADRKVPGYYGVNGYLKDKGLLKFFGQVYRFSTERKSSFLDDLFVRIGKLKEHKGWITPQAKMLDQLKEIAPSEEQLDEILASYYKTKEEDDEE